MSQKNFSIESEVFVPYLQSELRNVEVKASNSNEAIQNYQEELRNQGMTFGFVRKRTNPISGIIFFFITIFMSFFKYYENNNFNSIYLYPTGLAIVASIILYSSFVIRIKHVENVFKNPLDILISVEFILVLAIFINIFMGNSKIPSGLFGKLLRRIGFGNNYYLIIAAIILSWLGIKQLCGFVWIAIILSAVIELNTCGNYMGNFKGSIFLLSAFIGFIFYLKYEGKLIIHSFGQFAKSARLYVQSNLDESKKFSQNSINMISSNLIGKEVCDTASKKEDSNDEK